MKFCTNCGAKLDEATKFCMECGERVPVTATVPEREPPAPAPQPAAAADVHIYGAPVQTGFSPAVFTPAEQSVAHVYGTPVQTGFAPPVFSDAEESAVHTYGEVTPAPKSEPVFETPAPAPAHEAPAPEPVYAAPVAMPVYEAPAPAPVYEAPAPAPVYEAPAPAPMYATPVPAPAAAPKGAKRSKTKEPKQKKGGKKIALIAVVAILVIGLVVGAVALLGGGEDDPNLGKYIAVSCVAEGYDLPCEDEWIELKAGGRGTIMIEGEEYSCKWELDGKDLIITQAGDEFEGTLKKGVIVLDIDGVVYTYEKEDLDKKNKKDKDEDTEVGYWTLLRTESEDPDYAMDEETVQMLKEMGMEMYIELNKDGTGEFMMDELVEITWEDGKLADPDGETISYTLEDDQLIVELEEMTMIFVRGESESDPSGGKAGNIEKSDDPSDLSYWSGDWYGWWIIDSVYEGDSSMEGYWWDACATLRIDEDGNGSIVIWDTSTDKSTPLAESGISASIVNGDVLRLCSEDGTFRDCPVAHADWLCYSDDTDYEEVLLISGRYEKNGEKYDYFFYLRPWGRDWADIAEADPDLLPEYYADWYLPMIEEGVTQAPDTIG